MPFSAYVICATPRSGSTLLCDLLSATGVAGLPHSYLRPQDIGYWAACWGVRGSAAACDAAFNRAYLEAVIRAGSGDTGLFGLRLMWQSVSEAATRLDAALGGTADLATRFDQLFGPTLFIHLSRKDKEAQAVSLVRARQTGLWHVTADGSERERTAPPRAAVFDAVEVDQACRTLVQDDASWSLFFDQHRIQPLRVFYEELAAEPSATLARVLDAIGRDRAIAATVHPQTAKMADADSLAWVQRLKAERSPLRHPR